MTLLTFGFDRTVFSSKKKLVIMTAIILIVIIVGVLVGNLITNTVSSTTEGKTLKDL